MTAHLSAGQRAAAASAMSNTTHGSFDRINQNENFHLAIDIPTASAMSNTTHGGDRSEQNVNSHLAIDDVMKIWGVGTGLSKMKNKIKIFITFLFQYQTLVNNGMPVLNVQNRYMV